jgi:D-tyrosyl-tRNA(Tyr) deacylase
VIALIQRVSEARVSVDSETIGEIGPGLLALVGVEREDTPAEAARLVERVLGYRVFADPAGKMNLSLKDVGGALLAVPQFTLVADTSSGTRPGFSTGASPEHGERLFLEFLQMAKTKHPAVQCGRFGADMKVSLVNDGPVTFWLRAGKGPRAS